MHNATVPNMGKIGVLVGLESTGDKAKLAALGKQIAMHVAAANPSALDIKSVSQAELDRERAVLSEQARASGKPEEIIAKMVEGRLRKYYEDVVLLEQLYVIDGESRVKQVVEKAAKEIGAPVAITGFARMALGEGIAKEQADAA
jgi:elongation factor Ts